jgi:hypothetical protein
MPRTKSSASVTAAEIAREPRQPNRFEKNRNNLRGPGHGKWAVIMRMRAITVASHWRRTAPMRPTSYLTLPVVGDIRLSFRALVGLSVREPDALPVVP